MMSKYVLILSLLLTLAGWRKEVIADQLRLSWSDNSTDETGFQIERRTLNGTYSQIAMVGANVTAYSDSTVTPGTTYCYRVRAFNTEEISTYSEETCGSLVSASSVIVAVNAEGTITPSMSTANGTESTVSLGTAAQQFGTGIGVFRATTSTWHLDRNENGLWDTCLTDGCVESFGLTGDLPVVGDWDGSGKSALGIFRPSTGQWFLDFNGNGQWDGCTVDKCLGPFGIAGDLPVAGDWNNVGVANIGIFDPSLGLWELDMNGNGLWDGCQVDRCIETFGQEGDLPVVGKW